MAAEGDESIFPAVNVQHQEVMEALHQIAGDVRLLKQGQAKIMTKLDDDTAAVAASTAAVTAATAAIAGVIDGQASVAAEVAALKAQIAAGQPPDTTALDKASADLAAAVAPLQALAATA